jgi:predicted DNA-binding protein with PD1-like motif
MDARRPLRRQASEVEAHVRLDSEVGIPLPGHRSQERWSAMDESTFIGDYTEQERGDSYRKATGQLGQVIVLRLPPGADVYNTLKEVARQEKIASGVILSGVGSLREITLRNVRLFPDRFPIQDRHRIYTPRAEPLELLALTGNVSQRGSEVHVHAHAVVSSGLEGGATHGGHLVEGCIVLSTVEIVICAIHGMTMVREMDPQTRVIELYFVGKDDLPVRGDSDLQESTSEDESRESDRGSV